MRLFIALNPPPAIQKAMAAHVASLQITAASCDSVIRWVPPEQFHITLKFLGEQPDNRRAAIEQALTNAAKELIAPSISFAGFGTFPSQGPPQTIWIGLEQSLTPIVTPLEEALAQAGFQRDPRYFHAHVTVGRVRSAGNIRRLRESLAKAPCPRIGPFSVETIDLMQSVLRSEGPLYTVLRKAPLTKKLDDPNECWHNT